MSSRYIVIDGWTEDVVLFDDDVYDVDDDGEFIIRIDDGNHVYQYCVFYFVVAE